MKKLFLATFAIAAALAVSPVASAQSLNFTFTFSDGNGITANGTLVAVSVGNGAYLAQSGTIQLTGGVTGNVSGVLATPTATNLGGYSYGASISSVRSAGGSDLFFDDLIFPGNANGAIDAYGLAFSIPDPWKDVVITTAAYPGAWSTIYGIMEGSSYSDTGGYTSPFGSGTSFTLTEVPEGGASLLYVLLAGVCCFGAIFFRSRNGVGGLALA